MVEEEGAGCAREVAGHRNKFCLLVVMAEEEQWAVEDGSRWG